MVRIPKIKKQAWRGWAVQVSLFLLLIFALGIWQTRNNLGGGIAAPTFSLSSLNGNEAVKVPHPGKKTFIYLFAPWCGVCEMSASNLNWLRDIRSDTSIEIIAVALDYESHDSVTAFVEKTGVKVPIALGTSEFRDAYKVSAYPTYYVVDAEGDVRSASVGYSPFLGMALRSFF